MFIILLHQKCKLNMLREHLHCPRSCFWLWEAAVKKEGKMSVSGPLHGLSLPAFCCSQTPHWWSLLPKQSNLWQKGLIKGWFWLRVWEYNPLWWERKSRLQTFDAVGHMYIQSGSREWWILRKCRRRRRVRGSLWVIAVGRKLRIVSGKPWLTLLSLLEDCCCPAATKPSHCLGLPSAVWLQHLIHQKWLCT